VIRHQGGTPAALTYYEGRADPVFEGLVGALGVTLTEPVSLVLFDSREAYVAAQPMATEVGGVVALSPGSRREIGVVGLPGDETEGLDNALRHGLGYLSAAAVGGDRLPDLFAEGLAGFVERPDAGQAPGVARLRGALDAGALPSWSDMAAPAASFLDPPVTHPAARSVVHFLVDRRGPGAFLGTLRAIRDGTPWRQAVEAAYGVAVQDLEADWIAWLPRYLDGGWHDHPFYPDDLARAKAEIAAGRYALAAESLHFAEGFGGVDDPELGADMAALGRTARAGAEAAEALEAGAAALSDGRYEEAADLAAQASSALGGESLPALYAAAADLADRGRLGSEAQADLTAAAGARAWELPVARYRALRAAGNMAALGNQAAAAGADALADGYGRRMLPAGWALVLAGLLVLVRNVLRRRAAQRNRAAPAPPRALPAGRGPRP
jgi:hypothetical protein